MQHVELRPVEDGDLDAFFAHQRDPEAQHQVAFHSRDPEDRAAFDAHWARIRSDSSIHLRTILADDECVGYVMSFERDGEAEVGYWLGRASWGRGLATRALQLFLDLQSRRPLSARVAADHSASLRVLHKCGFEELRRERNYAPRRGCEIEEVVLELG